MRTIEITGRNGGVICALASGRPDGMKIVFFIFWPLLIVLFPLTACVEAQLSEQELIGAWQVEWECGIEKLEFKGDGSFVQEIKYHGGGHTSHTGKVWRIVPRKNRSDSGHVLLQDGVQFCSLSGDRLPKPIIINRDLATFWEWGRLILRFHPDFQGFVHQ